MGTAYIIRWDVVFFIFIGVLSLVLSIHCMATCLDYTITKIYQRQLHKIVPYAREVVVDSPRPCYEHTNGDNAVILCNAIVVKRASTLYV